MASCYHNFVLICKMEVMPLSLLDVVGEFDISLYSGNVRFLGQCLVVVPQKVRTDVLHCLVNKLLLVRKSGKQQLLYFHNLILFLASVSTNI